MIKNSIKGLIVAGLVFASGAAMASTNIQFLTFPGSGSSITTEAGNDVNARVTTQLTGGSELESMSFQAVDNMGNDIGMPELCKDIANRIVAGTYLVSSPFETEGSTEGTFGVRVRTYGLVGPGVDNNCGGATTDNQYFSNRLTLTENLNTGPVANNTGSGTTGASTGGGTVTPSWQSQIDALMAAINALTVKVNAISTSTPAVGAGANAAVCSQLSSYAGLPMGATGPNVTAAQMFVMSHGGSIPLISINHVAYGYWGSQSMGALWQAKSATGCN